MKTRGQALLPLLIVIVIVLSLGTAAIELGISNVIINRQLQEGLVSYYTTEAALGDGLLKFLRNPSYIGEDLQINGVACTITVSGQAPTVVLARCDNGRQVRKIRSEVTFTAGVMTVTGIAEIE